MSNLVMRTFSFSSVYIIVMGFIRGPSYLYEEHDTEAMMKEKLKEYLL